MDIRDTTTQYAAGGTALALLIAFLLFQPTGFVKWLQKKNYQYEVTFALYMLTPTEKFIFNSILFLTLSMLLLACIVYLPDHVSTMSRRAYYYFAGEMALKELSWQAAETLQETATSAADTIVSVASELAHSAQTTAVDAATAAQEAAP